MNFFNFCRKYLHLGILIILVCGISIPAFVFTKYSSRRSVHGVILTKHIPSSVNHAIQNQRDVTDPQTSMNSDKDFYGLNQGSDGISLNFADVPSGATILRISRSLNATGPWIQAFEVPFSPDLPQPLLDTIDGTQSNLHYRLEAISDSDQILKTYGILFIPRVP